MDNLKEHMAVVADILSNIEKLDNRMINLKMLAAKLMELNPNGEVMYSNVDVIMEVLPKDGNKPYVSPIYIPDHNAFMEMMENGEEIPKTVAPIIGFQRMYSPAQPLTEDLLTLFMTLDNNMMILTANYLLEQHRIRRRVLLQEYQKAIKQ